MSAVPVDFGKSIVYIGNSAVVVSYVDPVLRIRSWRAFPTKKLRIEIQRGFDVRFAYTLKQYVLKYY